MRTKVIDGSEITFDAQPSPFDDTDGLEADNMYSYILRQRDDTDFKSSAVIGTTRGFETARSMPCPASSGTRSAGSRQS